MSINAAKLMLKQGKTALLVCDIQSKFSKVTYEFDKMVANTAKLVITHASVDTMTLRTLRFNLGQAGIDTFFNSIFFCR